MIERGDRERSMLRVALHAGWSVALCSVLGGCDGELHVQGGGSGGEVPGQQEAQQPGKGSGKQDPIAGEEEPAERGGVVIERELVGSATHERARQVQRLTAEQVRRSLEVATGQPWESFDDFSGALGRPDLTEVTEEGRALNSTFVKIVEDAARVSCDGAIEADAEREPAERVILRHVTEQEEDAEKMAENVRYLMLRFWSLDVSPQDERLAPWLTLLTAPDEQGNAPDAQVRKERWSLVCVGLATHPNFLTY